jgi:amidase
MSAADLMLKPVPELAALVRGGEISAREVVGAALRRIEDLDDRIHAFVEVDTERAPAPTDATE